MRHRNVFLLLQDGTVFKGKSFGAFCEGKVIGETVFSTQMSGCVEALTDPCFYGKIVVQTFPLLGDFGIIPEDAEAPKPYLSAYIVREFCEIPSNFRSVEAVKEYFERNNIPGMFDVDTRALTKHLRNKGAMNGLLTQEPDVNREEKLKKLNEFSVKNALDTTSTKQAVTYEAENSKGYVAVVDLGVRASLIEAIRSKGFSVVKLPYNVKADEVLAYQPKGIILSSGAYVKAEADSIVNEVTTLVNSGTPVLGTEYGHLLLAAAYGMDIAKMKKGHIGNQPTKNLQTGRIYTTTESHQFTVTKESLAGKNVKATFVNVNDNEIEGLDYEGGKNKSYAFSVTGADVAYILDGFLNSLCEGVASCR